MQSPFAPDESFTRALDAADPLRSYRDQFLIPPRPNGKPQVYLCGHSLGLQPKGARALVEQELDDWARLGVEGHFRGRTPWYTYHETLRDAGARLVGALPHEVVFMNSLTVNLHLMLATFYEPYFERSGILVDEPIFPSDRFALQSHMHFRDVDPHDHLRMGVPEEGAHVVRADETEDFLERHGDEIDVVFLDGVNFLTGQRIDLPRLTKAAHHHRCKVGVDLAHAIGNVPLRLHEWGVDFAVWCSYKYLNGGPGAVGGCFIHEKNGRKQDLPRLGGWWGTDPATRFNMESRFVPNQSADGWQVSNPPILSMAPLRASLALFDAAGMPALREKSERLTAYLLYLLDRLPAGRFEVITPRDPAQRGSQISLLVHDRARELVKALEAAGIVCDFREPNVVRVAPVPLYNSYQDVWTFAEALSRF
jgi:kynureninase